MSRAALVRSQTRCIFLTRYGPRPRRSHLRPRLSIDHQFTRRNPERVGDIEQPLVKQAALAALHAAENGPVDARVMGQLLLRQPSFDAEFAYSHADGLSSALPCRHALRIVLAWSGGHPHKYGAHPAQSL